MTQPDPFDRLRAVHKAFSPEPLTYDQHDLYVDLQDVRGHTAFVDKLARIIQTSDAPRTLLLAGHPGSGKSTELRFLQHKLQHAARPYYTVVCELAKEVEVLDVDVPDLLIAALKRLVQQLRESGITSDPIPFRTFWEKLGAIFADVEIEKLELNTGLFKVAAALKSGPDARREVRAALEPHTPGLLAAANDVIGKAVLEVQKQRYAGLVIIVDDLEKMAPRFNDSLRCASDEYLFIHRRGQLQGLACHMIYTLPLTLAYSQHYQNLASAYGTPPLVVPMTQLRTRPPASTDHPDGIARFREIVNRRLKLLGLTPPDFFAEDAVQERLIHLSGGEPRALMILIGEALIAGDLPINAAAVDRAARDLRRAFARQLTTAHWPVIEQVRQTGLYSANDQNDSVIRQLIYGRALLQYCNDEEWYGVNPLVPDPPPRMSS